MTPPGRVGIVGLGLMGGSLARALAAAGVEVWGADADADVERAAARAGVTRGALADAPPLDLGVAAVPVDGVGAALQRLHPRVAPDGALTDLGSTKRSAASTAAALGLQHRFVGSHPLAGDHRSGWSASRADLFRGARVFVCPAPPAGADTLERVLALWTLLDAAPEVLDPAEHDRVLAWSSHLPQLASTALARALDAAGIARAALGPGGRDATRLAASSPAMWRAICEDNADQIEPALRALIQQLEELASALHPRDADALHRTLSLAQRWADPTP